MLGPYRVLDLTHNGGMFCGQLLADLGADVIAVEPPGGCAARHSGPFRTEAAADYAATFRPAAWLDRAGPRRPEAAPAAAAGRAAGGGEDSLSWWAYSRDKRSVVLDLEDAAGREAFRQLVRTADFLLESFAPGYLDGLGLGYAALAALNPRLVLVSITPFGQQGPKARWAASELTVLAASGVLLLTGDEDRPPLRLPGEQAFRHAGAEAAVGALLAHFARERDGVGQRVDVAAQTAAMMATQSAVLQAGWDKRRKTRFHRMGGGVKVGRTKSRFVYPCADGFVSITFSFGPIMGPYTRRLFEWLYEEGVVDAATRDKDWVHYITLLSSRQEPVSELDRCTAAIERFTRTKTKAELFAEGLRRRLLIVPVSTLAEVAGSEQLAARAFWVPVAHPELGRSVPYPGPFARFSATPIQYRRRAPRLGEHTAEVLGALAAGRPPPAPGAGAAPPGGGGPPAARRPARRPLEGVKVLDFSWAIATPLGVRYLADHGATVVHVESATHPDTLRTFPPFKDGLPGAERSGLYANVHAGKLGFNLNLGTEAGRAVARRLAQWADVVVESYSPRVMRKLGLHYEALRALKPDLVMLSSCLNGQTGPQAALAGFGTMGAQMAGFGALVGWPDRPPAGPYSAYTDYTSPKLVAVAILAALDHRRRTGAGQYIDFAQAEGAIHYLAPALLNYFVNGIVPERRGNFSAEHAPHGVYPAAGKDRWVAIACGPEAQWRGLCAATGQGWQADPRFASFAARQAHREALDAALAGWTAPREAAVIEQTLQAAGVPVHRVSSSQDAFADPQLHARKHFLVVNHPELGPVPIEATRPRLSRTPGRTTAAGPTFGQHDDVVLRKILGLTDEEIVALIEGGGLA